MLDELRRTLGLGRPRLGPIDDDLKHARRDARPAQRLLRGGQHARRRRAGSRPYQAFGELLRLQRATSSAPPLAARDRRRSAAWSSYDLKRRQALVEELQARLAAVGVPRRPSVLGEPAAGPPADRDRPAPRPAGRAPRASDRGIARGGRDRLARVPAARRRPPTGPSAERLLRAARRVGEGRPAAGSRRRQRRLAPAPGRDPRAARRRVEARPSSTSGSTTSSSPRPGTQDLREARAGAERRRPALVAVRLGDATAGPAGRSPGSAARPPPARLDEQLELIDAVLAARRHRERSGGTRPLAARLFGSRWQGERSHWPALREPGQVGRASSTTTSATGGSPRGSSTFLADQPAARARSGRWSSAVKAALAAHADGVRQLVRFLEFDATARFGPGGRSTTGRSPSRRRCFGPGRNGSATSPRWSASTTWPSAAATRGWARSSRSPRPGPRRPAPGRRLPAPLVRGAAGAGVRDAPGAGRVRRAGATSTRSARSATSTAWSCGTTAPGWRLEHWQRLPRHEGGGQLAVLRREFEKKSRHLPLRQLLGRAGNAVQAIKPVFLMSPLSVAVVPRPRRPRRSTWSSSTRPARSGRSTPSARSLRGRQAVVVGDSRQLPPTSFFDRLTGGDDDERRRRRVDAGGRRREHPRPLRRAGRPERMLRWHYRSRHESLIAVSNREFYDDRLVVFPSPDAGRRDARPGPPPPPRDRLRPGRDPHQPRRGRGGRPGRDGPRPRRSSPGRPTTG